MLFNSPRWFAYAVAFASLTAIVEDGSTYKNLKKLGNIKKNENENID